MRCKAPSCIEEAIYQTFTIDTDGKPVKYGPIKCSKHYQIECSNIALELYKLNGIKVIDSDGHEVC